jgi:hypothetical protein
MTLDEPVFIVDVVIVDGVAVVVPLPRSASEERRLVLKVDSSSEMYDAGGA